MKTYQLFGSRVFGSILQIFLIIWLAREAKVEEFGLFSTVFAFAALFGSVSDLGISVVLPRLVVSNDTKRISMVVEFHRILLLLFSLLSLIVLTAASAAGVRSQALFAPILFLAVILEFHVETQLTVQIAQGRSLNTSMSIVIRRITPLAVFAYFVGASAENSVFAASIALAFGGLLGLVHVYSCNGIKFFDLPTKLKFGELWVELKPTLANQLLVTTRNFEIPLVNFFSGPIQAAAFSVGQRFANPIALFTSSLGSILLPRMVMSSGDEAKQAFRKVVYGAIAATFLVGITIPVVPFGVVALFGEKYEFAVVAICIILTCAPLISITSASTAIVIGRGLYSEATRIAWIYSVCLLALVSTGSFLFGANGAAIASFAAALLRLGLTHRALNSS